MPAFEGLLEIIQGAGNLVRQRFALFTQNDMLVIGVCKVDASTKALPQNHR